MLARAGKWEMNFLASSSFFFLQVWGIGGGPLRERKEEGRKKKEGILFPLPVTTACPPGAAWRAQSSNSGEPGQLPGDPESGGHSG